MNDFRQLRAWSNVLRLWIERASCFSLRYKLSLLVSKATEVDTCTIACDATQLVLRLINDPLLTTSGTEVTTVTIVEVVSVEGMKAVFVSILKLCMYVNIPVSIIVVTTPS